jgi:hypothetical protein
MESAFPKTELLAQIVEAAPGVPSRLPPAAPGWEQRTKTTPVDISLQQGCDWGIEVNVPDRVALWRTDMVTPDAVLNLNRAASIEDVSHIKGCFLTDTKAARSQEYIC